MAVEIVLFERTVQLSLVTRLGYAYTAHIIEMSRADQWLRRYNKLRRFLVQTSLVSYPS